MTTAPPLPPCPVCGREPSYIEPDKWTAARVFCYGRGKDVTHDLTVYGTTEEEALLVWRRVAGGRK